MPRIHTFVDPFTVHSLPTSIHTLCSVPFHSYFRRTNSVCSILFTHSFYFQCYSMYHFSVMKGPAPPTGAS